MSDETRPDPKIITPRLPAGAADAPDVHLYVLTDEQVFEKVDGGWQPMPTRWHYGPTAEDPDPGKAWHSGCGGEVWFFKEGAICSKCGNGEGEVGR